MKAGDLVRIVSDVNPNRLGIIIGEPDDWNDEFATFVRRVYDFQSQSIVWIPLTFLEKLE